MSQLRDPPYTQAASDSRDELYGPFADGFAGSPRNMNAAAAVSTVLKLQVNLVKLARAYRVRGVLPYHCIPRMFAPIGGGGGGGAAGRKTVRECQKRLRGFACKSSCCGIAIHSLSPPQHNALVLVRRVQSRFEQASPGASRFN